MEKINLTRVVIERKEPDDLNLVIKHNSSGMKTTVTAKQLDNWAVQQLRKELLPPKQEV